MSTPSEILNEFQEGLTGYGAVISSDHAYIHQGKAFTIVVETASTASPTVVAFTTPSVASGKYVHWRPLSGYSTSAGVTVAITEDESYTGGSDISGNVFDRNRNIDGASQMQAFVSGVTATPAGLMIQAGGAGSAGSVAARSGGGAGGENEELLLKANTTYLVEIIPSAETVVFLNLFWYEEDGYTP